MQIIPLCVFCQRYRPGPVAKCEAYPDGIPGDILKGARDHRDPVTGDKGLTFVRRPEVPESAIPARDETRAALNRLAEAMERPRKTKRTKEFIYADDGVTILGVEETEEVVEE